MAKTNKNKLFGTDGIRGTVNGEKVNAIMAVNIAMAAGEYFYGKGGTKRPRVLIGKDTRLSGYMLEPALVAGFTSLGIDAITTGPLPTPGIAHLTNVLRCDLGVMISASHNPYQDNGIKLFNSKGYKLSDKVESEIEKLLKKGPKLTNAKNLGRARRMEDAIGRYIELIKLVLKKDENLLGMKIVLDCANGAGYKVGTETLFELGSEVASIFTNPDGTNINDDCGAMFPDKMALKTKEEKADLGIALDGDADRVIFSDESGNLIDSDQIIGVLALNLKNNNLLKNDTVVGTVMTNIGLEVFLKQHNINLKRVNVGDRYILDEMLSNNYNLGGEPSGHIIMSDHTKSGDGLVTAIKILSLLKKSGLKASKFLRPFKITPYKIKNLKKINHDILENKKVYEELKKIEVELKRNYGGRILIRPSGTEPLIRILVECQREDIIGEYILKIENIITNENFV
ncbi:MAG: phosphoglucosamine mutase [SAR116 cluster bacterium]|nr:phosphoglucosamine mutase [SAR116 cluster bacterium]RPH11076.1 MAG: phosphoglucosamine mutase [Alphaproteobacteria bacterium TMED54]